MFRPWDHGRPFVVTIEDIETNIDFETIEELETIKRPGDQRIPKDLWWPWHQWRGWIDHVSVLCLQVFNICEWVTPPSPRDAIASKNKNIVSN